MTGTEWAGRDAISAALVDLAAGRGLPPGIPVSPHFLELAQRHGLSGLLIRETGSPLARAVHSRMTSRRSVMLGHLRRILERLDHAGVRAAILKGPGVAAHYRDKDDRTFSDLDLLIEASRLETGLGVVATDEFAAGVPEKRPKADKRDIPFRDPSGMVFNVDVHWDLFAYSQLRGAASGASEEAWRSASPVLDSALGPHWALPVSTETCFLAAHAIMDHRFRLILFRDFVELARDRVSWDEVVETAGRWGLRSATYVPLWMARHALGAAVPSETLEALRVRSVVLTYLERALPRVDLVRFDGHSMHPVNLASVLLADTASHRLALAARAPRAFPAWHKRVSSEGSKGEKPRVLIVVSTDRRRGAEVFAERLWQGLVERGWMVEAVSLTTVGSGARAAVSPLTTVSPNGARRVEPAIAWALRRRIKSFDPDIVLANGGSTLRYGVLANAGLRSRLVYMGIGEPQYWIRSRRSGIVNRVLLRRTHRVLAVSTQTREQLIELEPKLRNRTEVTYTGVPESLFRSSGPRPDGPLRVVMLGSLSAEKDPHLALQAVAGVPGATLRFVGDGPLEGELREEVARLGIEHRVEFAGSVEDVSPHLAWADVLILTSRTEGLPAAILEAGAAGVATVSVDVGGVGEAIRDGVGGIVVPARDQTALIQALRDLAQDPECVVRMGSAARAHIRENFGMDRIVTRYADALADVMR